MCVLVMHSAGLDMCLNCSLSQSSRRQRGWSTLEAQQAEVVWLPESWGCLPISWPYCFEPRSRQFIVVGPHSRASCSPDGQEGNSK